MFFLWKPLHRNTRLICEKIKNKKRNTYAQKRKHIKYYQFRFWRTAFSRRKRPFILRSSRRGRKSTSKLLLGIRFRKLWQFPHFLLAQAILLLIKQLVAVNRKRYGSSLLSYEPGILRMSGTPTQDTSFRYSLHIFSQTGPPRRVDCMFPMGNQRDVSFPRTQRRNARLELWSSNLSTTSRRSAFVVLGVETFKTVVIKRGEYFTDEILIVRIEDWRLCSLFCKLSTKCFCA